MVKAKVSSKMAQPLYLQITPQVEMLDIYKFSVGFFLQNCDNKFPQVIILAGFIGCQRIVRSLRYSAYSVNKRRWRDEYSF